MDNTADERSPCVYEVVSGEILLSSRQAFFSLHDTILLPIMKELGINPFLFLITEIGRYGRFIDVYRYNNYSEYFELTDKLLAHPGMESFYNQIGKLINGTFNVELMKELPYMRKWM